MSFLWDCARFELFCSIFACVYQSVVTENIGEKLREKKNKDEKTRGEERERVERENVYK